jgi:nucleolar protein 56
MERKSSRDLFIKKARERVSEALKSRDMLLVSVTRTMDDIDKIANLLGERLEEWYGIYLPEVLIVEKPKYAQFVLEFDRDNPDAQGIAKFLGEKKADDIVEKSKRTMGAKLNPDDLKECRALAQNIIQLYRLREAYEKYQSELTKELCPNMATLAGSGLAAKLITHIGTLSRFAILPASTIQVIGAEKALFKHLKNRNVEPPKHGLIFQHPKISSSPKHVRGKIARLLANKLALAAKADYFTKNFMGDKLKAEFDQKVAVILAGK